MRPVELGQTGAQCAPEMTANRTTGQVEAEVEGNRSAVETLIKAMKVGPRAAHVKDMKIDWLEPIGDASGFHVRY